MKIMGFFVVLAAVCALCLCGFVWFSNRKVPPGRVITASVVSWEKTRLPGFGRVLISYTIHGRPYTCSTGLIPNHRKKLFRPRSVRRYVLRRYQGGRKFGTVYIASVIK